MDEKIWPSLLATVVSKASRMSIEDAQDYLDEKAKEGVITKDTAQKISSLLMRYRKRR